MNARHAQSELTTVQAPPVSGAELHAFARDLYPLCRSLTGQGVRETLDAIGALIPLERLAFATGTPVFDWEIPREWNIRDAWVKDADGRRVVDFRQHNLHVVSYSTPVAARMSLEELRPHLHTLPEHPDWIPYRTSYYRDTWGFCLTQRQLDAMRPGLYEVCIDSTLVPGELVLAESYHRGESEAEVLIWTHVCHPSLANDNLSAIAVATHLARRVMSRPRRLSYRFVFAPATIGAIAWLSRRESQVDRIRHGLVLASLGDRGALTYKRSRRGDADVDRAVSYVVARAGGTSEDFSPYGYDERQFCSPGFNLPVGRLTRTPNGRYPEYHTSADDLDFITPEALEDSLHALERILEIFEGNDTCMNLKPKCEPRLGRYGLYNAVGGSGPKEFEHALLWVLNLADGGCDLLETAARSGIEFGVIAAAAKALEAAGLLARAGASGGAPS